METRLKIALLLLMPAISLAQVPVDDDGNVISQYESGTDELLLSQDELQELVGPIALYPDDLLAIVLPASAYPLQVVEAARFVEAYENDSSLEPSPDWDESIVALTNYPEVLELLNNDLDWTLRLGEAVASQQTDVISAVEAFRDRAYAAGNLKTDEYQTVSEDDGVIYITPAEEDAIYVPYYEPAKVVYYQPEPVYYYYPRARPVYYYPYSAGYNFYNGYFWGVTTAFTIGWLSDSLHTHHYSYYGHPYYGHSYWNHWYRRPSINVYNSYYSHGYRGSGGYHPHGDRWRAHEKRREYVRREGYSRSDRHSDSHYVNDGKTVRNEHRQASNRENFQFRDRDTSVTPRRDVARNSNGSSFRSRSNTGRNSDVTLNSNARTQQSTRRQTAAQTRETDNGRRQESRSTRNVEQRVASLRQSRPATGSQPATRQQTATRQTATRSQPQAVAQVRNTQRQVSAPRTRQAAPPQQARRAEAPRLQRQSQPAPARQQTSRSESSGRSSGYQNASRSSRSVSGESRGQSRSRRR